MGELGQGRVSKVDQGNETENIIINFIRAGQGALEIGAEQTAQKNFAEAAELLFRRYQCEVVGVCIYRGFGDDGEDVAATALLEVYKSLKNFRGKSSLRTWIHSIVRNVCKDEYRKRIRESQDDRDVKEIEIQGTMLSASPELLKAIVDPGENIERKAEAKLILGKILRSISEEDREMLILVATKHSSEEISASLGLSSDAVRQRLRRIRQNFLQLLDG